ncbi:exosortase family protein XrtF [Mariniflexile litorale]|uniref:Exosortase family protein XrtF n=1 Tax=Mariniflexile litorale TaxID=3045158 RepID=A0AAU7EIQ0_9FLAO|nr:exosortase family protein XrtF [Mariniflexile sp. KMM 9835]MDQ8210228.1 exosortase family protein XrtF [Mariniflexile sp. KMM 9835]
MKALLVKYKSVIKFILVFLLTYIVLSICYKFYLQFSDGSKFYPDYITHLVAKQSEALISVLGYNTEVLKHPDEPSMKLLVNNIPIARIIEGCNSMSVIILFVSFIIAFASEFKTTFFYILSGSVLIYTVNLLRIVMLTIGLYHYPHQKDVFHTVVFPAIIYGMVFLLWIFWVNRFSKLKNNNE